MSEHYPLAIQDKLLAGETKADRLGLGDEYRRHLHSLMRLPAAQYRPLPKAVQFHKSRKKYRFALGGNRSSKSQSCAHEVYWYATGTHPYKTIRTPNHGWYCTESWEMVGDILWGEKLSVLLRPLIDTGDVQVIWHNKARGIPAVVKVRVPGGESVIQFKAYEQGASTFQGREKRYIANDEQFPQDVWIEQISRIGAAGELDVWASMTPIKAQPWLEEALTGNVPEDYDIFEYPLDDNRISAGGFIADSEIDRIIAQWPEEVQPTRRYGKWGSYVGAVYKSFSRDVHIVKESDERLFFPKGNTTLRELFTFTAIDFGANDPFVCVWMVKIPHLDNAWYIYDEYYYDTRSKGLNRLIKAHAEAIKAIDKKWEASIFRRYSDHEKQTRIELDAEGIQTIPASKDIELGIEAVQTAMKYGKDRKPHLFVAERCRETIKEFVSYSYPDDKPSKSAGNIPLDKNNHCCFVAGTMIATPQGEIPIENIRRLSCYYLKPFLGRDATDHRYERCIRINIQTELPLDPCF